MQIIKNFLILFLSVFVFSTSLSAAKRDFYKDMKNMKYFGSSNKGMKALVRLKQFEEIRGEIDRIDLELGGKGSKAPTDEKRKELTKFKRQLKVALNQTFVKPGLADVVMHGIAGKGAGDALEEIVWGDGDDDDDDGEAVGAGRRKVGKFGKRMAMLGKGAGYGLLYKASESVGKEIGQSVDNFVGQGFASGTGIVMDFFKYMNNLIFHFGYKPFEEDEVTIWKDLIINDLKSVERMLKDGGKFESRSRDMILRQLDDQEDDMMNGNKGMRLIWKDFSDAFAEQCLHVINEVSKRKGYYKKDDLSVFYALQLQKRLYNVSELLLKMNTLKDFSTVGEIHSVFPSIIKNIERLFDVLIRQLRSASFSLNKNKGIKPLGTPNYFNRNDDFNFNNDYPKPFDT